MAWSRSYINHDQKYDDLGTLFSSLKTYIRLSDASVAAVNIILAAIALEYFLVVSELPLTLIWISFCVCRMKAR